MAWYVNRAPRKCLRQALKGLIFLPAGRRTSDPGKRAGHAGLAPIKFGLVPACLGIVFQTRSHALERAREVISFVSDMPPERVEEAPQHVGEGLDVDVLAAVAEIKELLGEIVGVALIGDVLHPEPLDCGGNVRRGPEPRL